MIKSIKFIFEFDLALKTANKNSFYIWSTSKSNKNLIIFI
jgi:hypothetical protein